jgi:hypothetical protein
MLISFEITFMLFLFVINFFLTTNLNIKLKYIFLNKEEVHTIKYETLKLEVSFVIVLIN